MKTAKNFASERRELDNRRTKYLISLKMDLSDNVADGRGNQSADLISVLASRLCKTENQLQRTEQKLILSEKACKKKDLRIAELQKKLSQVKKNGNYSNEDSSLSSLILGSSRIHEEELFSLERKCEKLQNQIYDMVSFLADYGLVWVGENYRTKSHSSVSPISPDFSLLLNCIEDLNQLAGYGEPQISFTSDGATFKNPDSIPLTLYADGLVLFSGPFRPYTNRGTQIFVQDILDGFFPSELQHAYPDGVCFKVIDKHEINYKTGRKRTPFEGKGHKLGSKENDNHCTINEQSHLNTFSILQNENKQSLSGETEYQELQTTHCVETSNHSKETHCEDDQAIKLVPSDKHCDATSYEWKSSVLNTVFNVPPIFPSNRSSVNEIQNKKRTVPPQKLVNPSTVFKKKDQHTQSTISSTKGNRCGSNSSRKSSASSLLPIDSNSKQKVKHVKNSENKESNPLDRKKSMYVDKMPPLSKTKSCLTMSGKNKLCGNKENLYSSEKSIKNSDCVQFLPAAPNNMTKNQRYKKENLAVPRDVSEELKYQESSESGFCEHSSTDNSLKTNKFDSKSFNSKHCRNTLPGSEKIFREDQHNIPSKLLKNSRINSEKSTTANVDYIISPVHTFLNNNHASRLDSLEVNGSVASDMNSEGEYSIYSKKEEESYSNCHEKLNDDIDLDFTIPSNRSLKPLSKLDLICEEHLNNSEISTSHLMPRDELQQSVDILIENKSPSSLNITLNEKSGGQTVANYLEMNSYVNEVIEQEFNAGRLPQIFNKENYIPSIDHTLNEVDMSEETSSTFPKSIRVRKCKSILSNHKDATYQLLRDIDRYFLYNLSEPTAVEEIKGQESTMNVEDGLLHSQNEIQRTDLNNKHKNYMNCKTLTAQELLKKLPPTVIRDGKVIHIREGVAEIFQKSLPVIKEIHSQSKFTEMEEITLKVISENGEEIYMVHISPEETVGKLYTLLGDLRIANSKNDNLTFIIISRFTPQDYTPLLDNNLTLRQCKLIRNSVLYLQPAV